MSTTDAPSGIRVARDWSVIRKVIEQDAALMSRRQARLLVDSYYQIQDFRKAAGSQLTQLTKAGEPSNIIGWVYAECEDIEKEIRKLLKRFADNEPSGMGLWAQ